MLAELMKYLVDEQQREERARLQKSLALAKRIGIGPFRRAVAVTDQPFTPSEFFYSVSRRRKLEPLSAPPSPLACDIKDMRFNISNGRCALKESHHELDFTMIAGGLDLFISTKKLQSAQPEFHFCIRNAKDQYWTEDLLSMNRQMTKLMIMQLRKAIHETDLIQTVIAHEQ